MKLLTLLLAPIILLYGCKAVPTVYKAPSTLGLDKSGARLHAAVTSAKQLHVQVQASTTGAKDKLATLSTHLDSLGGTIAALEKTAPFEMKSQIETAQAQIDGLHVDATDLTMKLEATIKLESTEGQQLEEANAADKEFQAFKTNYVAASELQTTQLNALSVDKANLTNELSAEKNKSLLHRVLGWLGGILLVAAIGFGAFLWITGKGLSFGTAVASAIP